MFRKLFSRSEDHGAAYLSEGLSEALSHDLSRGVVPALSRSEKTRFHQTNLKTGNRPRQQMEDEEIGDVVDKERRAAARS